MSGLPGNFTGRGRLPDDLDTVAAVEPTNKTLPSLIRLTQRFSYGERINLVQNRIFTLEQRNGIRVVRGLTTDNGGFRQVTTRRIVDFAKRASAGRQRIYRRLNNERVRRRPQGRESTASSLGCSLTSN